MTSNGTALTLSPVHALTSEHTLGLTPRHDEESERAVLGAILLDNVALDLVDLTSHDFYAPRHALLYEAMVELRNTGSPVDVATLSTFLRNAGTLDSVGGAPYVASLTSVVPTSSNAAYYASPVREAAWLRKAATACATGYVAAMKSREKPTEILDAVERTVYDACQTAKTNAAGTGMRDVAQKTWEAACRDPGSNLRYGFASLDDLTLGLWPGQLIVIAARPSMGKTTFAVNLFRSWILPVAMRKPAHAAFFSLEVTQEEIGLALVSSMCRTIDSYEMRRGAAGRTKAQEQDLGDACEKLSWSQGGVHPGAKTLSEIRGVCRRLKAREQLDVIAIDYLQLISWDGDQRAPRHQQVAAIANGLKRLATEMGVPVVALAQLNREVESRTDHRPKMSDLRESGAIEQAADVLGLLHRESYYELNPEKRKAVENQLTLIVAKNRNGKTGDVALYYDLAHSFMGDGQR